MKIVLCIVISIFVLSSHAQVTGGGIKGKLIDSITKVPIADATISLINPGDSTLIDFTISNNAGIFEIKKLRTGTYRLIISHQQYQEIKSEIIILSSQPQLDLGQLPLTTNYQILGEVVVSSETPVIIRNDTIQFNTAGFKTRVQATAADLIKKLPGIEVDKEGNIRTQGEQVQKVYVDGKEFFGDDPKMATRNLTADMIESIQVFDDMSEQARFTKIDDGSRTRAINIKLKKDRNKGYFGKASVGGGNGGRYSADMGMSKFKGNQRISMFGGTNNVNRPGFSFSDVSGSGGNAGNRGSAGSVGTGLTTSSSAGLNYNDEWSGKWKITGSYFFSSALIEQEQGILRRSTFTDSIAVLDKESRSENKNKNHRLHLRLEYQADSLNSVFYTTSLTRQLNNVNSGDTSFTFSHIPSAAYLSVTGITYNDSKRNGWNWTNNLLFRHRFGRAGRTLTVGWNNTIRTNNDEATIFSGNNFFLGNGSLQRSINQNRYQPQGSQANNHVFSTSYTEPLGPEKLMELNYAHTYNQSKSDRKTFNYNTQSGQYDDSDPSLTNKFTNLFRAHRFGANFRVQKKKYNYQLGIALQRSLLENNIFNGGTNKDSATREAYSNFFPAAYLNFHPSRSKSLRISYNGRTTQPSISQLQNVADISDPLHIRIGNPKLEQEFNHRLSLGYNTFDILSYRMFAANIGFSTTSNKIVNHIDTLTSGIQLIKPENVNGFYQASSFIALGIPIRNPELKGSGFNFNNQLSFTRDVNVLYRKRSITKKFAITQGGAMNFTKEKLDISLKANLTYNKVSYSINTALNEEYFSQSYGAGFFYLFKGGIIFSTDFDYFITKGRAGGFDQRVPLWNASIAKQLFHKRNGELRFSVNDILNQNQSLTRNASDNYIQDTRSMVLKRFFMLSFLWSINKMGGQQ